jgi:Uma2 family endonuclease
VDGFNHWGANARENARVEIRHERARLMALAHGRPDSVRDDALSHTSTAEHIMGMPAHRAMRHRWTEEEFYRARDAAPPGERWELVDGEVLVTPSPHWTHQRAVVRLTVLLDAYVRAQGIGEVFASPLDVRLEPALVLQPDILVVPSGELRRMDDVVHNLLLAVENLSPSSARHDRVTKRPGYQRNGVPEYWIFDDRSQTVERWRPEDERPELLAERLVWYPQAAREEFVLDLPEFFARVLALPER